MQQVLPEPLSAVNPGRILSTRPGYMDFRVTAHGTDRRAGREVDFNQGMSVHLHSLSPMIPRLPPACPAWERAVRWL